MAKLDKLKKKIKQLERKLDQQSSLPKKAQKQIKQLNCELKARNRVIADLQHQLAGQADTTSESVDSILPVDPKDMSLALDHKHAWKKHKFLCDRYDVHLDSGLNKNKARTLANQDLMGRYGKEVGFTPEQLCEILS